MDGFFARHRALWISIVSVVAGLFVLWMTKALILSFALSMKTGISISVSDWSISWRSMSFKSFQIRTPSDPVYKTGLSIGSIDIKAGLFDLIRKRSHIESITINDVFMGVNMRSDGSSNWSKPLQKLSKEPLIKSNFCPSHKNNEYLRSQTPLTRKGLAPFSEL